MCHTTFGVSTCLSHVSCKNRAKKTEVAHCVYNVRVRRVLSGNVRFVAGGLLDGGDSETDRTRLTHDNGSGKT